MLSIKEILQITDTYFKNTNTAIIFKDDFRYIAFPCGQNCCKGIYIDPLSGKITNIPNNPTEPFDSIWMAEKVWFWVDDPDYSKKVYNRLSSIGDLT